MKNKVLNIAIIIITMVLIIISFNTGAFATTTTSKAKNGNTTTSNSETKKLEKENTNEIDVNSKEDVEDTIVNLMSTLNSEGLNKNLLTEATNLYNQISKKYTNEEIAKILVDNKSTLEKNGISSENIDTAVKVFNNISTEQTKTILNSVDVEELGKKIENGATVQEVVTEITSNMSTKEKVNLVMSMVCSVKIIKNVIILLLIIFVYRTLLRCVIYKKAGKHAWAAFVLVYRNVVMLNVCQMSAWWLLLLLVPVIGWLILFFVAVASKFMLAEKFGKGVGFSFGLWLLPVIFESILVFSKKTKYISEDLSNNEEF